MIFLKNYIFLFKKAVVLIFFFNLRNQWHPFKKIWHTNMLHLPRFQMGTHNVQSFFPGLLYGFKLHLSVVWFQVWTQ